MTTIVPGLMRTGAHVNTLVKGRLQEEFTWFSVSDNLPFLSMDATRAARQIVEATRLRKPQFIITLPAVLLDLLHRLVPDRIVDILGLVDHFLPVGEGGTSQAAWSMDVYHEADSPALNSLLKMGTDAARDNHEFPAPGTVAGSADSVKHDRSVSRGLSGRVDRRAVARRSKARADQRGQHKEQPKHRAADNCHLGRFSMGAQGRDHQRHQ